VIDGLDHMDGAVFADFDIVDMAIAFVGDLHLL
jgi:hypothetical protein